MSVPLDRLYNFLDNVVDHDIVIYHWSPHGSKLLKDLKLIKSNTFFDTATTPVLICHDQEPLNFGGYLWSEFVSTLYNNIPVKNSKQLINNLLQAISINQDNFLNYQFFPIIGPNLYNNSYVLLHSEKNSTEVAKYQASGAKTAYYWTHALIARDWFRYATIDPALANKKYIKKDFLVYNRAWTGTREYRLKFSELIVNNQLTASCQMTFLTNESGIDYRQHQFKNTKFKLLRQDLENHFILSTAPSWSSADYNNNDYCQCLIDIVLETVFDDQRIYLTEKTLRPIACKTPFILAAGPGSLQYLRDYGFRTFSSLWDESYDAILDSSDRLNAVVALMKKISQLSDSEKHQLYQQSQEICEYNHQHFFSDRFFNTVIDEYRKNLTAALNQLTPTKKQLFDQLMLLLDLLKSHDSLDWLYKSVGDKEIVDKVLDYCRSSN